MNQSETSPVNETSATTHTEELRLESPRSGLRTIGLLLVMLLAIGAVLGWFVYQGISARVLAAKALVVETDKGSVLTVSVTHPKVIQAAQDLVLPGNTQPLIDAPIYARTDGYLKKWYADIGAHVHAGELLAEIETPETDQQLVQAKANLEAAKASLGLAQVTAKRLMNLQKDGAIAMQDMDNAVADMNAKQAAVNAASANVNRLQELQSFEKVYAPFDGVVTARNTDIGALIAAGSTNSAKELFHIASTRKLRVYVSVPEQYEQAAKNGTPARLTLGEFPGRTFPGTVVRNSGSIDMASRTLLVEVDVDNPTGELLTGAYVSVHLKFSGPSATALTIPVATVMFRSEGIRAALVRDGKAVLVPITIGRDLGDALEVLAGVRPQDSLILNPPDSLISGTPVKLTKTL